jgi:hydroxymethylbilane synthase
MSSDQLVLATRRSALALAQARAFMARLVEVRPGIELSELHVTTTGDRVQDRALSEIGGKGLFIKEIEQALLDGQARLAVHSFKDVPAELAPGLKIACVPVREDPHDALVTRSGCRLEELPQGARVGTSSLRRRVQLLRVRPDLEILPLRGNVDTRLRKCAEGEVEAVVLACAGLNRLGLADRVTERLDTEVCLPAVGQGALAIEVRSDDDRAAELLSSLNDTETAVAAAAERGVMVAVEGSCQVPLGGYAVRDGADLWLRAWLSAPDGSQYRRREARWPWTEDPAEAQARGEELGAALKAG